MANPRKLDEAEVARRYAAGETVEALAAEFGCSTSTVKATVERAGVTLRARGRPKSASDEAITALFEQGMTHAQIAAELGVPRPTVSNALSRLGLRRRR
jgi:DNA-directed RNA polymerase specialized sigma24 family protein